MDDDDDDDGGTCVHVCAFERAGGRMCVEVEEKQSHRGCENVAELSGGTINLSG